MAFKKRSPRSSQNAPTVLHNVYILYLLLIICLGVLSYFALFSQYTVVLVFLAVGFLSSHFSKNMIVILFMSLVFSGGYYLYKNLGSKQKEGFKEEAKEKEEEENPEATKKKSKGALLKKKVDESATLKKNVSKKQDEDETKPMTNPTEIIKSETDKLVKIQESIINGAEELKKYRDKINIFKEKL
jgi:cell shape-determining protein MreC